MTIVTAKWSIADYHQMITTGLLDERSVELLRGEIIEMAPEGAAHSSYCSETAEYLRSILGDRAKVREAHPITLPNDSEPEPDVAIVRYRESLYRARHPNPQDIFWLIEISNSTLTLDLTLKKDTYAEAGILEYWVMNIIDRELIVFRDLSSDGYRSESKLTAGTISPLAFPDLAVDIHQLFA